MSFLPLRQISLILQRKIQNEDLVPTFMPTFDVVLCRRKRALAKRALRDSEIYLLSLCGRVFTAASHCGVQFELSHHSIQRCGAALGAPDVMIGPGGVPDHIKRPAFWAVGDQAAQHEAHLDAVNLALADRAGCGATGQWKLRDLILAICSGPMPLAWVGQ